VSERTQQHIVWASLAMTTIYGLALALLLKMIPPPSATWSATRIAEFYTENQQSIRWGAVVSSWCGAFMVPLAAVITIQMHRQERGRKIWSLLCISGGALMSVFLVLPPIFFGVAAYTPTRSPEITALMHELGVLSLISTDQFYIFMWLAVAAICFQGTDLGHSPFPRWFGYFTAWTALLIEAGAICFLTRTGPFAWSGLIAFWTPLGMFGLWIIAPATLLLRALRGQRADLLRDEAIR